MQKSVGEITVVDKLFLYGSKLSDSGNAKVSFKAMDNSLIPQLFQVALRLYSFC
jgi:hypothetical protein